jgi:hypothetical protein
MQIVQTLGDKGFSIGTDESGWDHHFTPQMYYGVYLVYKALLPPTMRIGVIYSDKAVVFQEGDQARLERMVPGLRAPITVTTFDGNDQKRETFEAELFIVNTESYLRRLFAGASGTDVRFGDVIVSGYKTVIDTPRDGKFLTGFGMRSGNYMTFYANSVANEIKLHYIAAASQDAETSTKFQTEFGYWPPEMRLAWSVVRGDDAGQVWEILAKSPDDWTPSQLIADWLTMTGGKANAAKQETSDEMGRWNLGFAQMFTNENFPRGVSSLLRVLERNVFNERDEVVLDDPDTGEDLRPYILLMNKVGRISNLYGIFGKEEHPLREELTALLQDIDVEGRMMPPMTEEERRLASRAFMLRLLRRGSIPVDSEVIIDMWNTGLAPFVEERFRENKEKLTGKWSPIKHHVDARPVWRGSKPASKSTEGYKSTDELKD